jgi:AraC-like DNA-binding protein
MAAPIHSFVPAQSAEVMLELFDFVEGVQCWIKDAGGVYQWVNRAFLLNYSLDGDRNQVVGRTDYDLSPKHLADQFRLSDDRVLEGNPSVDRIELVGRFDHVATWCSTTKLPIRSALGQVTGTAGITRPVTEEAVVGPVAQGFSRVLDYVRAHYAESPTNTVLAQVAGRSVRALEREFTREIHLTPQQYLRRVRVRLSCQDLVYSQGGLGDIALKHGFCDQSHFTREFRQETGMTPREYRLVYQPGHVTSEAPGGAGDSSRRRPFRR